MLIVAEGAFRWLISIDEWKWKCFGAFCLQREIRYGGRRGKSRGGRIFAFLQLTRYVLFLLSEKWKWLLRSQRLSASKHGGSAITLQAAASFQGGGLVWPRTDSQINEMTGSLSKRSHMITVHEIDRTLKLSPLWLWSQRKGIKCRQTD